jgi:CheY-like chemotaxis protein
MKFLVVEDSRGNAALYLSVLTRDGHDADITGDGDEALRLYKKRGPYDAVLTNMGHPGLSGIELAKSIRNQNPKQRIGFVCSDPQSVPNEYPALGKPARMQRFLAFVNEVANGTSMRDEKKPYVELVGGIALSRHEMNNDDLCFIGEFTRENVLRWMNSHRGPDWVGILPVDDFHAVCGDIDIPWAKEAARLCWNEVQFKVAQNIA